MATRKSYFVLPTSDYNASHIQLGSIISDMRLPYRALSPALTPVPKTHTAWKENYILGLSKALSASLGIQTQFLAQLGSPLGADIHVTGETANVSTWLIKRLETEFIEPEHQYVEDSVLKVPAVKKYLDARKLAGAVYMVTGIKVAKGVSYMGQEKEKMGLRTGVTIDAAALAGAPVSGGPQAEINKKLDTSEAFSASSDFVVAYRVQKLSIGWFWGSVKSKEKVGGDLAGVGGESSSDDESEEELENEGFEPKDINRVVLEPDGVEVPAGFVKPEIKAESESGEDDEFLYGMGTV
jgi:hypothetical protein